MQVINRLQIDLHDWRGNAGLGCFCLYAFDVSYSQLVAN